MANSLLNTAQQLKGMIEHAKLQAEAAKDAAITQVKLQAEAEKKEVSEQVTFAFFQIIIPRQTILFFVCLYGYFLFFCLFVCLVVFMVAITIVGCSVTYVIKHPC